MTFRPLLAALCFVVATTAFVSLHADAGDEPAALTVDALEDQPAPWRASLVPAATREKDVLRLGVIPVTFPDREPHPQATAAYWHELFFGSNERAFRGDAGGSLADVYARLSYGTLKVEGRVFEPVRIETTAEALLAMPMVNTGGRYREKALEALRARDGADALDGLDALCFIGAGDAGRRGRGLWPHRGKIEDVPYIQLTEGYRKEDLLKVGIPCHEFGHLFGFKDKYGLRNPRQGPGPWCLMGRGTHGGEPSGRDRPFAMCAWCRTQIGWLRPVTIDPRTPRRVRLRPVSHGPREALRVLLKADGSEYYLLEVRAKRDLERDLPDEGLLIWHVGERKNVENFPVREYDVVLEPPHTRRVADATTRYAKWSCWPKPGQMHFTPDTHPSSKTRTPDAWPVHIRNIERHEDRSVTFDVGPGPTPGDRSLPAPVPAAYNLTAVLLAEEGTDTAAIGTDRQVRREVDRLLFSQGDYYGPRRSLRGDDVAGSLRDWVEEASGMHMTVRGRRLPGTKGGVWRRVPKGALDDPLAAVDEALPQRHGADGVVAFVARLPELDAGGAKRRESATLPDGTRIQVVYCGDGVFAELGFYVTWWLRTLGLRHIGPDRDDHLACELRSVLGVMRPPHPCVRCKLRWGWIAGRVARVEDLRPCELFPEAWMRPDGTEARLRIGGLGFWKQATPVSDVAAVSYVEATRYPPFEEMVERVQELGKSPDADVTIAGRTLEGRVIHLVRVAGTGSLPPDERPALFLTGALHGNEASTVPAVLTFLEELVAGGAPTDHTVYAMPCVNADAYAAFVANPNTIWRPRANKRPFDDDGDGRVDEDGYEDLNGDGEIGHMRRKQPDGTWERLGREGTDDDGDGRVSEDIAGGVDLNRNFPEGWRPGRGPFKLSRGTAPLSEPESKAVADALRKHPNVALLVDVHNDADTLFVRMGPQAARGQDLKDHADWASYAPVIEAARRTFGYEPRRMGRAGILSAWAYEGRGIPGTILEIGSGAKTRAPSTLDAAKANAWSQEAFGIDGWNDWKPFAHPQLGAVEIGGDWKRFVKRSPPAGEPLGVVCARTRHFLHACLDALPRVALSIDRTSGGGWALAVRNEGRMPTATARLAAVAPERARLELTLAPGTLIARAPEGWTVVSRNAAQVVLAHAALRPGASLAVPLRGVADAENVTAKVHALGPGGGALLRFKPDRADAGEVKTVPMPEHRSHFVLHVPATYRRGKPVPLLVDLHGAAPVSRNPAKISVKPWRGLVAEHGFLHLLPQSRARAWGMTEGDDAFVMDCIGKVVKDYTIDRKRVWITGFSSGADYLPRFLMLHPKEFAAAAPLFPGSFPYRPGGRGLTAEGLGTLAKIPLLYVTGTEDVRHPTVRTAVYTMRTLGLDVGMRMVPDTGHVFPAAEEYAVILAFFEGKRPAGDPLPALAFPKKVVSDGHVALPPAPAEPAATLVVLPGRGAAETRPELRAFEAVSDLADTYRILLPWRAKAVDASFLAACVKAAGATGPVVVYAHSDAAGAAGGLLAADGVAAVVASGPRSTLQRALKQDAGRLRLHVLLGSRALDRKTWEPLLEQLSGENERVTFELVEGTRLFEPPSPRLLRRAIGRVIP